MTVRAILEDKGRDVVTIEPTATIAQVVTMLAARRIGAMVVLGADQRVVGVISERDVVRAFADHGTGALDQPLAQYMTRKVATCAEGDTVAVIMEQMTVGKFRHVPVIDQERLVGIVSIGDVVKSRLREMEEESSAMREYIRSA